MGFLFPKPQKPPPPPPTPKIADTAAIGAEKPEERGYTSMISTTPTGLKRRPTTARRTLIGGT